MMKQEKKYKIKFEVLESTPTAGQFKTGEVFIRQGTPHMVVEIRHIQDAENRSTVTVCNLASGAVWGIPGNEEVAYCLNPTFNHSRALI